MPLSSESPGQFASDLLRRLGIQPNTANTRALVGWMQAEGGHWKNQATFNPLNTTQPMPGAGNTGSQGNIKAYRDWAQGLDATARTLKNGRYGGILRALQGSDPAAVAQAIGASPWGTSADLVSRTISGTPAQAASSSPAYLAPSANPSNRRALLLEYLADRHNPDALLTLAQGLQGESPAGTSGAAPRPSVGTGELVSRANAINAKKLPYQWGGGHAGKVNAYAAKPLDCSGAVSAVLGINPRVSGEFRNWGKPGEGSGRGVVIYSNPKHVLMSINGHFFGTSASNPGGGAGWIPRSQISREYLKGFTARHM